MLKTIAEEWIEEGTRKGLKQGLERGLRDGLLSAIEVGLELRFGLDGLRLMPEISKISDVDVLKVIREGLKAVRSLDELQRVYRT